mmetsp:Transcript_18614/g.42263  ORF Transcript_18614/g.42263 Transcript_18614/m.42263 type:complete len:404 (+) Transcript_18614:31-1242(+)
MRQRECPPEPVFGRALQAFDALPRRPEAQSLPNAAEGCFEHLGSGFDHFAELGEVQHLRTLASRGDRESGLDVRAERVRHGRARGARLGEAVVERLHELLLGNPARPLLVADQEGELGSSCRRALPRQQRKALHELPVLNAPATIVVEETEQPVDRRLAVALYAQRSHQLVARDAAIAARVQLLEGLEPLLERLYVHVEETLHLTHKEVVTDTSFHGVNVEEDIVVGMLCGLNSELIGHELSDVAGVEHGVGLLLFIRLVEVKDLQGAAVGQVAHQAQGPDWASVAANPRRVPAAAGTGDSKKHRSDRLAREEGTLLKLREDAAVRDGALREQQHRGAIPRRACAVRYGVLAGLLALLALQIHQDRLEGTSHEVCWKSRHVGPSHGAGHHRQFRIGEQDVAET